jgi:hypothetical protein
MDSIIAENDKARREIGGDRTTFDAIMRASIKGDPQKFIAWRFAVTFEATQLRVRFDSLLNVKGDSYEWEWCEGQGAATWEKNELHVPAEIATNGRRGSYSATGSSNSNCNANFAAGKYMLVKTGDEPRFRVERDGALATMVFVKDEEGTNFKLRAKELAGNKDKE